MNEQEFIYGKLKNLTESVDFLMNALEKHQSTFENLLQIINKMQSPEYARTQARLATNLEVEDKIALVKSMMSKK